MSVNINDLIGAVEKVKQLRGYVTCTLTGSAYMLGPEHAKDLDLLVLVDPMTSVYGNRMLGEPGGSAEQDAKDAPMNAGMWSSYRDGDVNFIVTNDRDFYAKCVTAAEVCKTLGLADKNARIRVYRVVRDGFFADDPEVKAYT